MKFSKWASLATARSRLKSSMAQESGAICSQHLTPTSRAWSQMKPNVLTSGLSKFQRAQAPSSRARSQPPKPPTPPCFKPTAKSSRLKSHEKLSPQHHSPTSYSSQERTHGSHCESHGELSPRHRSPTSRSSQEGTHVSRHESRGELSPPAPLSAQLFLRTVETWQSPRASWRALTSTTFSNQLFFLKSGHMAVAASLERAVNSALFSNQLFL
ncbi:uncharacterized protein ISCGN_019851 [Ixodes scapularis]